MTKLQAEVQQMFAREREEADRSHAVTLKRHREIMRLIEAAKSPCTGQSNRGLNKHTTVL